MTRTITGTPVAARKYIERLRDLGPTVDSTPLDDKDKKFVVTVSTVNTENWIEGVVTGLPMRHLEVGEPTDFDNDGPARVLIVSAGRAFTKVYEIPAGRLVTNIEHHD